MQNLRALRQRIRSVQNTQKITKAMQMVAGAKLRRMQSELTSFRPYAERLADMTKRFLAAHPDFANSLMESAVSPDNTESFSRKRESDPRFRGDDKVDDAPPPPAGLILITSDTGLCGTYNERVLDVGEKFLLEFPSAKVIAIGKKGNRLLARKGIARTREILDWGGRYEKTTAGALVDWCEELYLTGRISSWHIAYTQFISALQWKPVVAQLLPLVSPATQEFPDQIIIEPDVERFAGELLKKFVKIQFARILLEAFTAEHSARMIAMKNATENATEMIDHLTLVRNKARQAAITKELIEVVSGAQALQ